MLKVIQNLNRNGRKGEVWMRIQEVVIEAQTIGIDRTVEEVESVGAE